MLGGFSLVTWETDIHKTEMFPLRNIFFSSRIATYEYTGVSGVYPKMHHSMEISMFVGSPTRELTPGRKKEIKQRKARLQQQVNLSQFSYKQPHQMKNKKLHRQRMAATMQKVWREVIGIYCSDEVKENWKKIPGHMPYRCYALSEKIREYFRQQKGVQPVISPRFRPASLRFYN